MIVKIKFSKEYPSDFSDEEKLALIKFNLERVESEGTLIEYRVILDNISKLFSKITSLGFRNKLVLGVNEEGKTCQMILSK